MSDSPQSAGKNPDAPGHAAPPCSVTACLARLAAGDSTAKDELVALACDRMRTIAHRMLGQYPTVRRYEDTDDVVQNALVRLHRALSSVTPESPERFLGLAALQVRRELLDLARRYSGPESAAAHHETDSFAVGNELKSRVAQAPQPAFDMDRWTHLHEAAAALPEQERRLFDLAWYMGLPQDEVASVLGCSLRTVKRRWGLVKEAIRGAFPNSDQTAALVE